MRIFSVLIKIKLSALAGVAQWIECWPVNQRVAGSIPRRGTCLSFRSGPQCEPVRSNQWMYILHINVSLPPSLPLSLKNTNK